jgi:hypothetical protein
VGLKGKSEDQPHAKQIAPAEGVTPPAEVRVSFLTTPLSTRGGAFRSSSDPGEGTRAPGASWASRAATTRIGPGFAMSSATRTASFPQCAVVLLTLWLDITEAVKFAQPILDVARFVLILAKRALELFHCEWLAGKHTSLNTVKHSL